MKKFWIGTGLLFCLPLVFTGCGKERVEALTAVKTSVPFVFETEARPEALHSYPVIPQVSGAIVSDIPDVGTAVTAGQLLFQIDTSKYEAQAAEIRSRIASGAAVTYAPTDDSMEASLLRQGIITRAEYERLRGRKASAASSSASADTAQLASLQAVKKMISECTVLAPIDGVISQNYVRERKLAAAGNPALVIRQNSPVIVTVEIPAFMDDLLSAAKQEKTLTVTISEKNGSRIWYGELKKQANDGGDSYTAYRVQADNSGDAIAIGETYLVRVDSGKRSEGYVIPDTAFVKPDQLAVVTADNLVDFREVQVANDIGDSKLVIGGLSDGDRVILAPDEKLTLGTEVSVK